MANVKDQYKGEPSDPTLENGPIEDRECRDILCCLLFIASCVALVAIAIVGWSNGHPARLAYPYDPDGRACGSSAGVQNAPYIYLAVPFLNYLNHSTCVSSCPTWQPSQSVPNQLNCTTNKIITSCNANPNPSTYGGSLLTAYELQLSSFSTDVLIYNTTPVWGRVCFPTSSSDIINSNFTSSMNFGTLEEWFSDVKACWTIILASAGFAFVFGIMYMLLVRYCAKIIVWLSIFAYLACLTGLGFLCYWKGIAMQNTTSASAQSSTTTSFTSEISNGTNLKALAIVFWAIALVSLVLIFCLCTRIQMAIAIVQSSADYVRDVLSSLFVPPVSGFCLCLFWAFWIVSIVFVYSIGKITNNPSTPFASVQWTQNTKYMLIVQLFCGLWTNAFISALTQFILASSVCIWYFSQGTGQGVHRPISRSVYRAFRYHLGSIAFGAFILALVQFVRLMLEYVNRHMQASGATQNRCVRYAVNCLQCCAACFERFIKFLNRNAYIQIALTGKGFIAAAKDAFFLILRNPLRFGVVAGIGHMFIFIGRLFVCATTTIICYAIITNATYYSDKIFSSIAPTILFVIISYVIGSLFMSVYGMAVDAILQCACLDEELQKAKGKPAQHCPEPLKQFFEENLPKNKV